MRALPASCWRIILGTLTVIFLSQTADAQLASSGSYQAYRLEHRKPAEVEELLNNMFSGNGVTADVVVDSQAGQILVRGPAEAQEIAKNLIETVDRPPAKAPIGKAVFGSYACEAGRLEETARRLREEYGADYGVRVAVDSRTPQLLVLAPPEIHLLISKELAGRPVASAVGDRGKGASGVGVSAAGTTPPKPKDEFVPLVNTRADVVEMQLRKFLQGRLEPQNSPGIGQADYVFVDTRGGRAELTIDEKQNGIKVFGPEALRGQLVRLIEILDNPLQTAETRVRVLRVQRTDPAKVRRTLEAYRSGARGSGRLGRRLPRPEEGSRSDRFHNAGVELVSYLFQEGAGGESAAEPATRQPGDMPVEPAERDAMGRGLEQLGSDVEIETLPDLDVIILKGRGPELEEIAALIEELERLSEETEPVIEIYPLKYVRGESIQQIVQQVQQDLIGGRQGRVSITPLIKPDSLLLIGWGEAVEAVKELVQKLDKPVPPDTQFKVFRLLHAPVYAVSLTLTQALANRGGLAPSVEVISDFRTNSLIVRASDRDMAEVVALLKELDTDDGAKTKQAKIIRLKNSLANDMSQTLGMLIRTARGGTTQQASSALELLGVDGSLLAKSGLLSDVEAMPDVRTNSLMITGPPESMEFVEALIAQLDVRSAVAQIKVYPVENADATSLAMMLRTLMPSSVSMTVGPQLPASEDEGSLVPVRFSVDTRTNCIIVTGSEGDLGIIEALILRLDQEGIERRTNEVYRLKNAPATDVARSINEFLRSERMVQQAAPGTTSPFQQIESEVIVVPEPVSNSLIISATPRFFDEMMELVEKLDEAPDQVMIQVLIAEISLNDTDEFGIEMGLQDSILFDRSLLKVMDTTTTSTALSTPSGVVTTTQEIIQSADNTPGFLFNDTGPLGNSGSTRALDGAGTVASQALSSFAVGRLNNELGFGGLVLSASSEAVSILIRALQESKKMEILSRPQIMTLDNQPAYIQVGKRVPRISASRFSNSISTNDIVLENIGLILGVTPRISPDGNVVMEIDAEKSEMGPEQEGVPVTVSGNQVIRSPSFTVTRAQTTVSAQDGQTVVLGGLISKNETTISRRVPGLADIPVLGNLFRYDLEISKRTELLIILTPHVITSQEQMERMKQLESSRIHWCLADVTEMFGDTGLYDVTDGSQDDGAETVVYPDADPIGTLPEGSEPLNPSREGAWPPSFDVAPPNQTPAEAPPESGAGTSGPRLRDRFFSRQRANEPPPNGQFNPITNAQHAGSATFAVGTMPAGPEGEGRLPVPSAEYNAPLPDPNAPSRVRPTSYVWPPQSGIQPPQLAPSRQSVQEPAYYRSDAGWNQWNNTVYR